MTGTVRKDKMYNKASAFFHFSIQTVLKYNPLTIRVLQLQQLIIQIWQLDPQIC